MRQVAFMMAAAATLVACAESPEQERARMDRESASARTAIEAANVNWNRWAPAGQADSVASLFTDDGRLMTANRKAAVGRDAIRAELAQRWGARPPGQRTSQITTETVMANGPLAVEIGRVTSRYQPAANAPRGTRATNDTAKYITIWRKTGDRWLVAADIGNSDLPAQPPQPSAPPAPTRRR